VSDRILVLRDGRVAQEFTGDDLVESRIVRAVVDDDGSAATPLTESKAS